MNAVPPPGEDCGEVIVVMGVSGVGKTTIAEVLADRLGWTFLEADDIHSEANRSKMAAGMALTDEDRAPWLAAIRDIVTVECVRGRSCVVACSALRRSYRDVLREAHARVRFVELTLGATIVAERLHKRRGHYMPPSLLASQLATLEHLAPDESGVQAEAHAAPHAVVDAVVKALGMSGAR